jgi:hypothetical protein
MMKHFRQQAIEWFAAIVIIVIFIPLVSYYVLCIVWQTMFWLVGYIVRIALDGFLSGMRSGEDAADHPSHLVRWIKDKATAGRQA